MRLPPAAVLAALLALGAGVLAPAAHVAAQAKADARAEQAARKADQVDEAEAAALQRSEAARRAMRRAAGAGQLDDPGGLDPLDGADDELDDIDDYDDLDDGADSYLDELNALPDPGDESVADLPAESAGEPGDLERMDEIDQAGDLDPMESDAYLDAPSTADPLDDAPAGPSTSLEIFRAAERSLQGSGELGADYDDDFGGTLEIPGE